MEISDVPWTSVVGGGLFLKRRRGLFSSSGSTMDGSNRGAGEGFNTASKLVEYHASLHGEFEIIVYLRGRYLTSPGGKWGI